MQQQQQQQLQQQQQQQLQHQQQAAQMALNPVTIVTSQLTSPVKNPPSSQVCNMFYI